MMRFRVASIDWFCMSRNRKGGVPSCRVRKHCGFSVGILSSWLKVGIILI